MRYVYIPVSYTHLDVYKRQKEMLGGRVPARMDLFTYMEEEIFQLCSGLKNSPFKQYLRYWESLGELEDRNRAIFNLSLIHISGWRPTRKLPARWVSWAKFTA